MIRLVWRGVRFARGRAVALAAGMLVAAVAFSLLTASVEVNAAAVKGVVGANWRGEYDLLVLPRGSVQTGAGKRLVQVNYLSASTSGITMAQYARVARLPGVAVAAPLEIVGYLLETAYIPVVLSPAAAGRSGSRVLVVTSRYTADQGLSAFPPYDEGYVYIAADHVAPLQESANIPANVTVLGPTERLPDGKSVIVCPVSVPTPTSPSPFQRTSGLLNGACYSRTGSTAGPVEGMVAWSFPVLVAGIDPRAENELTGLGGAVTSGKYLAEGQGPVISTLGPEGGVPLDVVPMLASTASFDGDTDHVTVSLLPSSAVTMARSGASEVAMARALGSLAGTPVMQTTITGAAAWQRLLAELTPAVKPGNSDNSQFVGQYWTAGPVTYRPGPDGQLDPVPASNPVSIWTAGTGTNDEYVTAPPAAADTGYRALTEVLESYGQGKINGSPPLVAQVTGEFDPERLPGFSGGGPGSPLASYQAPLLTGADAASRAALRSQPLEPDGNMAGYAQQPPLLYTTMAGAAVLQSQAQSYAGIGTQTAAQLGSIVAAPIGSIRVRVSGLRGTVQEQLDKIGAIGEDIEKATGLQVIVTAGASPYPVTIGLPARQVRPARPPAHRGLDPDRRRAARPPPGRPGIAGAARAHPRRVRAVPVRRGARRGARRRAEIGALRAVGWGRWQVCTMVLGEVVTLGIAAGLAGAGLSAGLISGLGLHLPLSRALLVLPVAIALAGVSGLAPSWAASRIPPAQALMPAARAPRRGGRRVRTVTGLAITGVVRTPGRSAVAATGLAVGVAGLTVLLAAHVSFATSIGDSELAGLVNGSTRGTDLVSVLLTIALSAAGLADLTYLNLRERAGELAALAASGWGRRQLGRLLTSEAVVTAVTGSVAGAAIGLTVAGVAFGLTLPVLATAAIAAAGGTAVTLVAVITVLLFTSGRPLAAVLAADE